jgi:RNA polymerase sigma factor (sigma-70 family)
LLLGCNVWLVGDIYVVMDAESRFRAVFAATYPAVARYVRYRGLSGQDAEDLVAATYEVAWRRLDALPAGERTLPWLLTVALNELRNHHRKRARERALLDRLPVPENYSPACESVVSWKDIRGALEALSANDRELVLLVAWDGLTPAQAGSVLGLKPVTARSRLHRARARMAEILERDENPQRSSTIGHEPDEIPPLRRSGA